MSQIGEMPRMSASNLTTTAYRPGANMMSVGDWGMQPGVLGQLHNERRVGIGKLTYAEQLAAVAAAAKFAGQPAAVINQAHKEKNVDIQSAKQARLRVVRVFLVDTDDRVPVDQRVLHKSEEMITDATDDELFFKIPVQTLLDEHNRKRSTMEWEEATSSGTHRRNGLKELRIRDLSMQVATIASF